MTTKEKITETALDLFSQRGYDGVSVRDIARAVGIRESSIYNHFQSKRAVFDAIVDLCVQQSERYFREGGLPYDAGDDASVYAGIGMEDLQELIERTFPAAGTSTAGSTGTSASGCRRTSLRR